MKENINFSPAKKKKIDDEEWVSEWEKRQPKSKHYIKKGLEASGKYQTNIY